MATNDPPVCYGLGTFNGTSGILARSFAMGCRGKLTHNISMLYPGDMFAFFTPELYPLLEQAIIHGRNYYYCDHAYFRRKKYYRITKNAKQHPLIGEATPHRFEQLGFTIRRWRKAGDKILLCPQTATFFELHKKNRDQWIADTTRTLRQYTDRKIIVRDKVLGMNTEALFEAELHNVWAVVVYTSVAGMQAAIHGVPCFATEPCVSQRFGSGDLSLIEKPVKPHDRERMAWILADNQWTIDEIRKGFAWSKLEHL